jgi:Raf kinase inhibitor-like YbhB/YbcL family protein
MTLSIKSPAFDQNTRIPDKFAKDGSNLSPELRWSGAPEGTRSFALMIEDPDAPSGMFRHWAVYDIPADRTSLAEGQSVAEFGRGANDFGNMRYDGPQPPRQDGPHHYHFRLAALDTDQVRGLPDDASAASVWDKIRPHVLEEAELVGTYEIK